MEGKPQLRGHCCPASIARTACRNGLSPQENGNHGMPLTRSSTPVYSQGPAPCLTQSGQVSECQLQEAKSQRVWKRRSQCPCLLTTALLSGSTAQQGRRYLGKVRRNEASGEQGEANMTLKLLSLSGWFQSLESVRSSDMCMTLNVSLRRGTSERTIHVRYGHRHPVLEFACSLLPLLELLVMIW